MARRSFPRYFISRPDTGNDGGSPEETLPPSHVVDSFFAKAPHLAPQEWMIATDCVGNLQALPDENRDAFPEAVRAELTWHEVSGGDRKRVLEVAEFFLFYIQLLEQPAGTPGLNDPVYLYGTLYGPYPATEEVPPSGVEGQLTVTRADLLEGLLEGAGYPFRCARPGNESSPAARCFQLMLPADREEEIERGCGVVLAYPLLPPELILDDVSNEIVVTQLLYDLMSAIKEDLTRENTDHPLRTMTLPVPSRFRLEQQLLSNGYEIKGDTATKKVEAREGFQGFLASVFGPLMSESLELPPQGKADDFLNVARITLNALPGWPSPRALALRNRMKPAPQDTFRDAPRPRLSSPTQVRIPAASSAPPPVSRPRARARTVAPGGEPPEWMKDFISAHRQPGSSSPRLTSTAVIQPSTSNRREPEWMKDFDQVATSNESDDTAKSRPIIKSDWMKDFE